MPDWEDRVDPNFDFLGDSYSKEHSFNPYENDEYSHQIYEDKAPYDGILLSLSNFQSKIKLKENDHGQWLIRNKSNVRDYLKVPKWSRIKIMGDCGAFSYVTQENPPDFYSVDHVAEIYSKLKFDYGVSPDHIAIKYLIVNRDGKKEYEEVPTKERERRRQLTLQNSQKFMEIIHAKRYKFKPIGVAQGYDLSSYEESVKTLVSQGYGYIALGALVQYSDEEILKILDRVHPHLEGIDLHLFGIQRPNKIKEFRELGVTSFDSASYFRKAWLRSGQNYLASNGTWYSAIRIPFSTNKNLLVRAEEAKVSQAQLEELEADSYHSLIDYSQGRKSIDDTLSSVMAYDKLLVRSSEGKTNLEMRYRKTLRDKPWEKCKCEICQKYGIEILIFRGTNRNKRRGYHNTWTFKNIFMKNF